MLRLPHSSECYHAMSQIKVKPEIWLSEQLNFFRLDTRCPAWLFAGGFLFGFVSIQMIVSIKDDSSTRSERVIIESLVIRGKWTGNACNNDQYLELYLVTFNLHSTVCQYEFCKVPFVNFFEKVSFLLLNPSVKIDLNYRYFKFLRSLSFSVKSRSHKFRFLSRIVFLFISNPLSGKSCRSTFSHCFTSR